MGGFNTLFIFTVFNIISMSYFVHFSYIQDLVSVAPPAGTSVLVMVIQIPFNLGMKTLVRIQDTLVEPALVLMVVKEPSLCE